MLPTRAHIGSLDLTSDQLGPQQGKGKVMSDNAIMSAQDLSEFIGVPYKTLLDWRVKGYGPPAVKLGKHLRYLAADVDQWIAEQREDAVGGQALAESHLVVGFRALLGVVSSRVEAGWFEYGMSD